MPMLAEPRKRKKWILLPKKAPLKPIWAGESEDVTFGQKMMEKMGWSTGKGLGANEQGIQEPLRVCYKNDTKGMGYKLNEEEWISQQDEFNDLLNQLSSETDLSNNKVLDSQNSEIKSLEEKSKQSRNRVHYQKFTRGKDLSRYSENDLACILGLNKMKTEANTTENNTETKKNDENLFGVKTIHGGSSVDYFKNKLVDLKESNKSSINSTSNIQIDNHYFQNEDENHSVDKFSESEIPIKKKKLKKSKHASPLNDLYSENEVFYENTDDCTKEPSENLKKRKGESSSDGISKKKIKKVVDINEIEQNVVEIDQNIDSEMCVEEKKCQDIILDTDQTNNERLSKKKKKCKEKPDTNMCTNLADTSNESKKVKKKKNKSETISEKISSNLEEDIEMKILEKSSTKKDENSTEICNTEYKSAKKKKKSKEKEKNLLNAESTINHQVKVNEQEDYNSDKVEYSKKKKKSKRDVETAVITNTLTCITTEQDAEGKKQINDNVTTETMEVNFESEERIEKKKKKRKKDKVADCMNDESVIKNKFEEEFNSSQLDHKEERSKVETPNSVEKKKKRKKDKKEKKEKVIEDNTGNTEENKIDSTNSAKVEHKVKKKKNKNKDMEKIKELESEAICKNKVNSDNVMAEDKNESSNQKRESISKDGNADAISEKTENELNNLEKNNLADSENNIIHTHKLSLLNRKNKKTNMSLSNMDNSRILQLYCGADINCFRGSNLAHLEGYGKSLTRENVEGLVKR